MNGSPMTSPLVRRLSRLTWREVDGVDPRPVLVVPLGATEQHGPHLPFTVDTEVAVALSERLASARPSVVLAPPVPYGSSGEHAGFPGTLSLGRQAFELLVVELGRSTDAFAGLLLVCGHGGNAVPLHRAVGRLRAEGRRARAWSPGGPDDDSHAGRTETSVMLALRPEAVRLTEAEPGATSPLRELMPALRSSGVVNVSPNGVLGDPRGATAQQGAEILDSWTADLLRSFDHHFGRPAH
ncbi:mycofactocin biosynthesis peptidyl-dipeptidase MftE [Streptomyces sp. NBC_00841]|uniref:mycofactocin biosynthesis peptidyl-dipeptidase MftE n=1 Tax=Streptomyces sp. NBC_00841 TaxID=2975847 RepID=UPI002DD8A1F0|nr:mycofactocin biosynthesis peptidyl-dipeptidase MftE [Streptomyces sp. NBC_00841]WSA03362.1 mycofactocin biosynthesis peptidyl-dipeptidase MftE [Streptomyces sp. NBC_00841]